jgi:hypothetical protein
VVVLRVVVRNADQEVDVRDWGFEIGGFVGREYGAGNNGLLLLLLVDDVDLRRDHHRFGVCVDVVEIVDRGGRRRGCCCSGEFEAACSVEGTVSYYSGVFEVSFSGVRQHRLDMVTLLEVLGVPFLVVLGVLGIVRIDLGVLDRVHIGLGALGWEDIELEFRA